MARYIEREKAIKNISQIRVELVGARATILAEALRSYRDAVLKVLKETPTTDVVPRSEVVEEILNLLSVFNKDHSKNHSIKLICTRYGIDTKKYIGEGSDNGREQS